MIPIVIDSRSTSRRGPSQKVDRLKGHTDQLQLPKPLALRGLRWLTMIMEASSIDLER